MPEPTSKRRLATSLEALKELAEKPSAILEEKCSIRTLRNSMDRMFPLAKTALEEGDQELAYIYFFRYVIIFQKLKNSGAFAEDEKYCKAMVGSHVKESVETLEALNIQLNSMYEQMEKSASTTVIENEEANRQSEKNENATKTPIPQPLSTLSMTNGLKEVANGDRVSLSSIELFSLYSTRTPGQNLILIIDVRLKEHFEDSSMKLEDVINIPETVLKPGRTANRLEDDIDDRFKSYFKKRGDYEWVILVDWFTSKVTNDPNVPINLMLITLVKWDRNVKYKNEPIILEGGYDDWLSRYPSLTTNSAVSPPRFANNQQIPLAQISYPETLLEPAVIEIKPTVPQGGISRPTIDRSTKPGSQDRKTENAGGNFSENASGSVTPKLPHAESVDKNGPKSILKRDSSEKQPDNTVATAHESSDTDEDELQEKCSQRGRRSALASAPFMLSDDSDSESQATGGYRDAGDDEQETNMSNIMTVYGGPSSGLKRSSSTPNISKLAANEYSRPMIDRSTKPSNDDQLNDYRFEMGRGVTGLKNLGNTCYMNSIIQCLSNTDPLRKRLCAQPAARAYNERSKTRGAIAREVRNILSQLWSGESGSVSCKALKNVVGEYRDTFRGYEQQDSHEFLTILMDWMHEDLKHTPVARVLHGADESTGEKAWGEFVSKNDSIVRELFYGQLRSTVCCSDCGKESITFEPFSNLSLPLPPEERCTLAECLKLYISDENIPGWQCPGCNKPRNATKKLDITRLPPLLVIHFKRFTSDGWCRKRQTNVDFPNLLDMTPFIKGLENRDHQYKLYAVSNHFGTMESGHYTAYCLNAPSQKWYKFDDQEVSPLSGLTKSSSAYIVFYQSMR